MKYCCYCGEELVLSNDYYYEDEDYELEEDDIVIETLTCPSCGNTWECYSDEE